MKDRNVQIQEAQQTLNTEQDTQNTLAYYANNAGKWRGSMCCLKILKF